VDLLRRSGLTANEIAASLGITHNAVRAQLSALQRDGLVRELGLRSSGTRPAVVYELTPQADSMLSQAYIPFVAHLVQALSERLSEQDLDDVMRSAGRRMAAEWPRLNGDIRQRVNDAAEVLMELGSPNAVEDTGDTLIIRGYGCLLAAAIHGRPGVCRSMESLLAQLIDAPVHECCERGERPRCCFQISLSQPVSAT
jgi:predicted ArsR family transcriptional regulator